MSDMAVSTRIQGHRVPRRAGIALASVFLAVAFAFVARAAIVSVPGATRLSPVSVSMQSSPALPPEVQALEAQTVSLSLDRDTRSEFVAYDQGTIELKLEGATEIRALKVFGAAPYAITVKALQNGAWNIVPGLDNLKLATLPETWNRFTATTPVTTDTLRFELAPAAGGKATGLKELELWGTQAHGLTPNVAANPQSLATLLKSATSGTLPSPIREYRLAPADGVVNGTGFAFAFNLDRNPIQFKRAFLAYEVNGLTHWVSPVRAVNGNSAQGGAFVFGGKDWSTVVEPVHPFWFNQGANRIAFALPTGVSGAYSLRNVRVVAELDDGMNAVVKAEDTSTTPVAVFTVLDGDIGTGWAPYGASGRGATTPQLTLSFDRPTALDGVTFYLNGPLNGTLALDALVGGQWQNAGSPAVNGRQLTTGWNTIPLTAGVPATALRLSFQNGTGSLGEIEEILAVGSGVGSPYPPRIEVAYPDAGQYYGREAYLRGFLATTDNGSGPVTLTIGGKAVPTADGAFGVVVNKNDVGFASQADAEPWYVDVIATYPNNEKLTTRVNLTQGGDRARAHMALPGIAAPGFAQALNVDEASLDIDPDALVGSENITITPLAEGDLPRLDPGMTNVTKGPRRGWRFNPSPHKFRKPIKVTLPYDNVFVPPGMTEQDIKTYYFDTEAGRWFALERVAINTGKKTITSVTDHFTDMINATVVVPEHPQAVSFNPTQIKDIKAADPGAGINLIEPPKANNQGDARLSYPIEIPPGRSGMQPQLAISYSSGGGNGWLGLGWDLSIPSIGVETRWGVPRYRADLETETYTLNGQQLTPVAHRGPLQARTAEKIFHSRVEGAFQKIIRHGDHPTKYWWEVIDKNGTRNFYGSKGTGQDGDSILGSGKGAFKWMLTKTVDSNGNTVTYDYERVTSHVIPGGKTMAGQQLYIRSINYTGHDAALGAYAVAFTRETGRPDITIDARGGFKQVTADRLKTITVKYQEQTVRTYVLNYDTGAFEKTLLAGVVQNDANGVKFNEHRFDYYDDIRDSNGDYKGFVKLKDPINTGEDRLASSTLAGSFNHTMIGGTKGSSGGMDGYVGIGVAGPKMISVGVAFGASQSRSSGTNTFTDVDGDGLPDKVFITKGGAFYRPNTTLTGDLAQVSFASENDGKKKVPGFAPPSENQSSTSNISVQGFVASLTGNGGTATTNTRDMSYLSDVNGDGLVDLVSKGRVLFNTARDTGVAGFSRNSYDSDMPLGTIGGSVEKDNLPDVSEDKLRLEIESPLMDNVRRWVAPYDGEVRVSGGVRLIDVMTDPRFTEEQRKAREEYKQADGVKVGIQLNGAVPLWTQRIQSSDYSEYQPVNVSRIPVKKGDRIHFRVQSVYDGAYDQVAWSPKVEYVDGSATLASLDANNLNAYRFQAGEDFVMGNRPLEMTVPYRGSVRLAGILNKTAVTSDDVTVRVTVIDRQYAQNGTYTSAPARVVVAKKLDRNHVGPVTLAEDFAVERYSSVWIDFVVDSQIDLSVLKWGDLESGATPRPGLPKFYYTEAYQEAEQPLAPESISTEGPAPTNAEEVRPTSSAGMKPIPDEDGNPLVIPAKQLDVYENGQPKYTMPVKYDIDIYSQNHLTSPQQAWVAPKDGVIFWTPWVTLKKEPTSDPAAGQSALPDGSVVMTAKRAGTRLVKQEVLIRNSMVVESSQGYDAFGMFQVKAGDRIFFDASTRDSKIEAALGSATASIHYASDTAWQVPMTDSIQYLTHIAGSAPATDTENPTPVDGRAMLVIRNGEGIVAHKQILDFARMPVVDLNLAQAVAQGEHWYFDVFTAKPDVSISTAQVSARYSAANSISVPVTGKTSFKPVLNFKAGAPDGEVTLDVYRDNTKVATKTYGVKNGQVQDTGAPLALDVLKDQTLTFAYSTVSHVLSSYLLDKGAVTVDYLSAMNPDDLASWTKQTVGSASFTIAMPVLAATQTPQPSISHLSVYADALFGRTYRGWASAAYNGNGSHADEPINESLFVMSLKESDYKDSTKQPNAWFAYPDVEQGRWLNMDESWWVSPLEVSASRKGLDNVYDPKEEDLTEEKLNGFAAATRPPRMGRSTQRVGGFGMVLSMTLSSNTTTSQLDLLDMNGDRFPDVVGPGATQFTWADGTFFDAKAAGPARASTDQQASIGFSTGVPTSAAGAKALIASLFGGADTQNKEKSSISVGGSVNMGSNQTSYDKIDVNGDGLPDRVAPGGGGLTVQINNGYGFEPAETWSNGQLTQGTSKGLSFNVGFAMWNGIFGGGVSASENHNYTHLTTMDINGDGLPDVLRVMGGQIKVWINNGAGFVGPINWPGALNSYKDLKSKKQGPVVLGDGTSSSGSMSAKVGFGITLAPTPITISFSVGANAGQTVGQPSVSYTDVNGDGFVDSVISADDSEMKVALNPIQRTNLLKQVRRPLGGKFSLDYVRVGNTYDYPQSKYVMSKVTVFDGVTADSATHANLSSDWQYFTYSYDGGKYDRYERDFLGFAKVVTQQHDTTGKTAANLTESPVFRVTTQAYLNRNSHDKGLLKTETLTDAQGAKWTETENQYQFRAVTAYGDTAKGTTWSENTFATVNHLLLSPLTVFPENIRTEKRFYEGTGNAGQKSYTAHEYDDLGNVVTFTDGGDANDSTDDVTAAITYTGTANGRHGACADQHLVGLADSITVSAGGSVARRRTADFNCANGDLKAVHQYLADNRAASTDLEYDSYGNLKRLLGPANNTGQRLELAYAYDSETETYPVDIRNVSYGLSSTATYDYRFGKPLTTTDVNGNAIAYTYDAFGRTKTVLGPLEVGKADYTIAFEYAPYLDVSEGATGKESWARTKHADRDAVASGQYVYKDPIETVLFTDGLKRILQTKKDVEVNGTPKMVASGRTVVDGLGRTIRQYYPVDYPKGTDTTFMPAADGVDATETTYDLLDRATQTTLPDKTVTRMDYGFGPDAFGRTRFKTEVTDALGNKKDSFRDVRELITSVTEYNRAFGPDGKPTGSSKAPVTTKYAYDALKQITRVIDTAGNLTNVEYDLFGRRTVIDNPDTGRTETQYDLASNPVKKITANLKAQGKSIDYVYDFSRLAEIRYPNYPDHNVAYVYGTTADKAHNQAGRVKRITDQSGITEREYGTLGETVKETITLTAAVNGGAAPPVYTTKYDFDTFGRLQVLTLPDQEPVIHSYDAGGNVKKITGQFEGRPYDYLKSLAYDKFEQRTRMVVGNNVATDYSYDPRNRRLVTLNSAAPGDPALQQLAYTYDNVGNITALANNAPVPPSNTFGGPTGQTFQYDDLYRLVGAEGFHQGAHERNDYTLAVSYDATHNITHKNQHHWVTRNGGKALDQRATTYDWAYQYKTLGQTQPHAPSHIGNRAFTYDANGNQTGWTHDLNGTRRTIVWDEENRIREVQDPRHATRYVYNDQGERRLKYGQYGETAYLNQFFTVRNGAIASAHIFAGTTRVATKLNAGTPIGKTTGGKGSQDQSLLTTDTSLSLDVTGTGQGNNGNAFGHDKAQGNGSSTNATSAFPGQGLEHRSDRANVVARNTEKNKHLNGGIPGGEHGQGNSNAGGNGNNAGGNSGNGGGNSGDHGNGGGQGGGSTGSGEGREFLYYFHPDHLGSSSYVTDANAKRYEHLEYFPFGETFVEDNGAKWRTLYHYTSKPIDPEVQLYYFGARYYDPRTSVWQSPDPIDRFNAQSPTIGLNLYQYGLLNPLRYTDPTGLDEADQTTQVPYWRDQGFANEGAYRQAAQSYCQMGACHSGDGAPRGAERFANTQEREQLYAGAAAIAITGGTAGLLATGGPAVAATLPVALEANNLATSDAPVPGPLASKVQTKPTLQEQAAALVPQNAGRNRVTLQSPSQKMEVDLAGKSHGGASGVPTPHTKVSPINPMAPKQPSYNTKSAPVVPATQQDIRTVRRYLERQ